MKVIDNSPYDLGIDVYGNHHDVREIHPILLKIMDEVDRICRKNNIPYALGFGSALGLCNYGGFIPWDEDADIVIDYFDIPRFIEALKKDLNDDFTFDCYETNHRYCVITPTFKIRYKNSYIKEKYYYSMPNRCKNGDGIFIDVVAFMGVPSDPKEHMKLIKFSKRWMPYYVFLNAYLRIHPYILKKRLKKLERKAAEQYKNSPIVSQTVIIPFQDWEVGKNNLSFPRDVIYPFKEYDFEGRKYFSFNNVEEFCRLRYGEQCIKKEIDGVCVDPFPVEKRHSKHNKTYNLYSKNKK